LRSAVEITRFEKEGVEFQTRVRTGFAKAARLEPARFFRLKARSGSPEEMAARVLEELDQRVLGSGKSVAKRRTAKPAKRPRSRPGKRKGKSRGR
jgi:hypothetical protein